MAVSSAVLALGALGGGAYILTQKAGEAPDSNLVKGTEDTNTVKPGGRAVLSRAQRMGISNQTGSGFPHGYVDTTKRVDTATQQAFRAAQERIKKEYEEASAVMRQKGAIMLNNELGTNLTGEESFEEAGAIIGAATGGMLAAAGCSAIGLGGIALGCKALGAIAGAYLGKKVAEYIGEAWDSLEDWASEQGDEVVGALEDAWNWAF